MLYHGENCTTIFIFLNISLVCHSNLDHTEIKTRYKTKVLSIKKKMAEFISFC